MSDTNQQAIQDAVEQIGLSMAANAFPLFYVAQNVYDTSESVWNVWNARNSADELTKIETGIDLVFAVVGWVPVVGAGVKRTFRLVNHKSEIYGPVLFDILRLVLQKAGVHTSPEELVDKLFDASGLKKLLTESREHIEHSWLYRRMPTSAQLTFNQALAWVEVNLPYWLGVVTRTTSRLSSVSCAPTTAPHRFWISARPLLRRCQSVPAFGKRSRLLLKPRASSEVSTEWSRRTNKNCRRFPIGEATKTAVSKPSLNGLPTACKG